MPVPDSPRPEGCEPEVGSGGQAVGESEADLLRRGEGRRVSVTLRESERLIVQRLPQLPKDVLTAEQQVFSGIDGASERC